MTDAGLPNLDAVAGLSRRQLHFIFLVDTSGSMTGEKMASLNYAVRSAIPAMREAAADNPEVAVMVRVLQFGADAAWYGQPVTPVETFEWMDLTAGGETALGAALGMLGTELTAQTMAGRQLPPVLVLLSDGHPTDEVDPGLAALHASPYGSKAIRIAVAIGSDADMETLQSFINHPEFRPLQAHNADALVNRIKWAATVPLKAASSPRGGANDTMGELARETILRPQPGGDIIW